MKRGPTRNVKRSVSGLPRLLREARLSQNLRLTDIARKLGVTIETISRAEFNGKTPISENTLIRLACCLGVDVDEALRLGGFIPRDIRQALLEPGAFAAVRDLLAEVAEVE